MLKSLIEKNRSYRRFYQNQSVSCQVLKELVELARLTPSGANLQPLKYYLACDPIENADIFSTLKWAGYLKNWPGPEEGERPSAYIVITHDKLISENIGWDQGFAAQTIMLGAVEKGLGGCIIASMNKPRLAEILALPQHLEILLALALGHPKEAVLLEPMQDTAEVAYWRDEQGTHHVPKRPISEIIINSI